MSADCYRVDVIHHLNPSLIWVEVCDASVAGDDFVFEQIGLYGIVPLETTIDDETASLVTLKSNDWVPAANSILKSLLLKCTEIWFLPTHIDRRSTIFDDNIHKYGELIIKNSDGKLKKASKHLVKSGFAKLNVCEFHSRLSHGDLNTELDYIKTQDVIKQLEKHYSKSPQKKEWEKSVKKHTSVFQMKQDFESELTVSNLEKHNNIMIRKVIENKTNDFELCKELDDKPLGRAFRKPKQIKTELKSNLLKKKSASSHERKTSLDDIKRFLDMNSKTKDSNSECSENTNVQKDCVNHSHSVLLSRRERQINSLQKKNSKTISKSICTNPLLAVKEDTHKKKLDSECSENTNVQKDCVNHSHSVLLSRRERQINSLQKKNSKTISKSICTNPLLAVKEDTHKKKLDSECSENTNVQKDCVNHSHSVLLSRRERQINSLENMNSKIISKYNCTLFADKEDTNKKKCTYEDDSMYEKSNRSARQSKIYDKVIDNIHIENSKNGCTLSTNDSMNLTNIKVKDISTEDVKEIKSQQARKTGETNEQDYGFKKMVAFGPPGFNPCNLKVDELKIIYTKDAELEQKDVDKEDTEIHDLYANVDSEVQIEITNKKSLNDLMKTSVKNSDSHKNESKLTSDSDVTTISSVLQRRLRVHKILKCNDSSLSSSDTSNRDSSSAGENKESFDDDDVLDRIDKKYSDVPLPKVDDNVDDVKVKLKNNVNPFKNIDSSISVFVDKLVTPVLMVHSKMNKRIEPVFEIRDVYFNSHIRAVLKNMSIERLMMLETITWSTILRGFSLFMVSPMGSGKTMGYLPAVCRLVSDGGNDVGNSVGPMCIVVCATAKSVTEVERLAKMLLGLEERVLACYAGVDHTYITTALLNGCDILISTPPALARLLQLTDFGVDLRRLSIFVLDDCERLTKTYNDELKFFQVKINAMLKVRLNKELKVQYIIASRVWCDFMESLAKKAPDSVICIGAFQECVLYSKASTSVSIIKSERKLDHVFEFLNAIDTSKKTVIVCETNNEVELLEKALKDAKYVVFACDNNMTVHDLYSLSESWGDYQEPVLGPILVCCDGNLTHMNITDAHYLFHFSLPQLFSMFCKRFAVLNDNYPSIFKSDNENIKIKIILEESNVQQLPKIVNFIKRCTENLPLFLDEICAKILTEKDSLKAEKYVPLCDNLLALGVCPDFYNCKERHTILKEYDTPKEWVPRSGVITFKIIHYHSATLYSARLLSVSENGNTLKFPQTYSTLSLKMGMYFGKESNRKLHGMPEIGDICAVAMKLNFFARCQVLKVLNRYQRGNPNKVLVKLIDEEIYEITRDIFLYYLPDELKEIETKVVQIRLANIEPKDRDITFSDLARRHLKNISDGEEELFMKAQVSLALGNCIFVTTLEACQELSSLNETVVKSNFKHELLMNHAINNFEHLSKIEKLCIESGLSLKRETKLDEAEVNVPVKNLPKGSWAHLESGEMSVIMFASAISPEKFFVRLDKFESCMGILLKDIKTYVEDYTNDAFEVKEGEIVLAKFPDDATYERARIDNIDGNKVKCFFVDLGDWREVQTDCLVPITEQFINRLPFQAIECRLVGVLPPGKEWTDFSTNWFCDSCYEGNNDDLKRLYVNYFTKELAEFTNGYRYGVVLIDTNAEQDIVINELMIDLNLARENEKEIKYFENILSKSKEQKESSQADNEEWERMSESEKDSTSRNDVLKPSNTLFQKPLRSLPLVDSDVESDDSDKWDVNINADTAAELFHRVKKDKNVLPSSIKDRIPNISPDLEISTMIKPKETQELDSDDLTSPEASEILKTPEKLNIIELDQKRRPKIVWRQNKNTIIVKIQLVADAYELKIEDRLIDFSAFANDTKYEFDFELFGVINKNKSSHINKGQYILVKLSKVLNKNWLTLTRDGGIKKWIVYDVDFIDASSDEELPDKNSLINIVKNIHDNDDSESDNDFYDDAKFSYKKH